MKRFFDTVREAFMKAVPMEICQDGREILEAVTSDFIVPASWGMCAVEPSDNGVSFMVNGFLHAGKVTVRKASGQFEVILHMADGHEDIHGGFTRENLADAIDSLVERDERYRERVFESYLRP